MMIYRDELRDPAGAQQEGCEVGIFQDAPVPNPSRFNEQKFKPGKAPASPTCCSCSGKSSFQESGKCSFLGVSPPNDAWLDAEEPRVALGVLFKCIFLLFGCFFPNPVSLPSLPSRLPSIWDGFG